MSTPFPLMQLAMMMVEATPSPWHERSIFSVGFVPLSSSIGSGWPSTLPRGEACSECQRALTQERMLAGRHAHLSDVSAAAEGSSLLSTIAAGSSMPKPHRSRFVMLFSRKETSGIPQKSVIPACSSTTLASFSAASPVMLFQPTLHHQGTQRWYEKHREGLCRRDQRGGQP